MGCRERGRPHGMRRHMRGKVFCLLAEKFCMLEHGDATDYALYAAIQMAWKEGCGGGKVSPSVLEEAMLHPEYSLYMDGEGKLFHRTEFMLWCRDCFCFRCNGEFLRQLKRYLFEGGSLFFNEEPKRLHDAA